MQLRFMGLGLWIYTLFLLASAPAQIDVPKYEKAGDEAMKNLDYESANCIYKILIKHAGETGQNYIDEQKRAEDCMNAKENADFHLKHSNFEALRTSLSTLIAKNNDPLAIQLMKEVNRNLLKLPRELVHVQADTLIYDSYTKSHIYLDDYYISAYETTYQQFVSFLNSDYAAKLLNSGVLLHGSLTNSPIRQQGNKYILTQGFENHPVIGVTFLGARHYAHYRGATLPSRVQWEFAAKEGIHKNKSPYSGSNEPDEISWNRNNAKHTREVGSKRPNKLLIYDMTGNVWEWCSDVHAINTEDTVRIVKGGCIKSGGESLKIGFINYHAQNFSMDYLGFRICLTPPQLNWPTLQNQN